jgi:hypothetical protein
MLTFAEFATHLERAVVEVRPALEIGLASVGELTKTMAAEYIGHEMPEWAPLSQATMDGFRHPAGFYVPGKRELGFTGQVSATDPLLRTGGLRDSIDDYVDGLSVVVGSPLDTALWQEMGTVNPVTGSIPPRPFLALAMNNSLEHAEDVFGEIAVRVLVPAGSAGR